MMRRPAFRPRIALRAMMKRLLPLFLLLLAIPALAQAAASTESATPWRVVLIRSWDSLFTGNILRERSLRETLTQDAPREVEFYPEEIDPLRFAGAIEGDFASVLKRKYRDTPVDLVVASGIEALEFATRHREEIWPRSAIVFSGVFDGALEGWVRPPRTAGVMLPLDIEGTVALGRALVPALRNIYVVAGTSTVDYAFLELATRKLSSLDPVLQVHYLSGLTRDEASARVAGLGPDSLVLYLTMLRDGSGRFSGPSAPGLRQVVASSSVPVVSPFQTQIGYGILGASAPRHEANGRAAGEIALAILTGADADKFPVIVTPAPDVRGGLEGSFTLAARRTQRPALLHDPESPPEPVAHTTCPKRSPRSRSSPCRPGCFPRWSCRAGGAGRRKGGSRPARRSSRTNRACR
jgi:hypothetical protein